MRAFRNRVLSATVGAGLVFSGCLAEEEEDVCQEAQSRFQECGVTVPLFTQEECSAAPEAVAECVLELTVGCNELSTWLERLDECIDRFDEGLEPIGDDLG